MKRVSYSKPFYQTFIHVENVINNRFIEDFDMFLFVVEMPFLELWYVIISRHSISIFIFG